MLIGEELRAPEAGSSSSPSTTASRAARALRPVIVLPTFNNATTLSDVLERVDRLGLDTIVVNDGSIDDTASILESWRKATSRTVRQVFTHPVNRGKAAALQTAFRAAQGHYTHAITIDTDGQLAPEDVPALIEGARENASSLILGLRDDTDPAYPRKSRIGRRLSNFFVRLESGATVQDSQCGLRVYPLDLVRFLDCRAKRYCFETQILTRAAWAGATFVHVPVSCKYLPPHERISHFRPWIDTLRSIAMHAPLLARAMVPIRHRRWAGSPLASSRSLSSFFQSLSPARAYRQLRHEQTAAPLLALSLAIGVFIANLPLYGLHAILALYTARRLHLNPLASLIGTQISTPPLGPILNAFAIATGHFLLHGSLPATQNFNFSRLGWQNVLGPLLLDWVVGGLVVGFLLALLTFLASAPLLRLARARVHAG